MYTLIIECVYVDSEHKSWPKRTEARVTNKQRKERTHHVTFLKLYIDVIWMISDLLKKCKELRNIFWYIRVVICKFIICIAIMYNMTTCKCADMKYSIEQKPIIMPYYILFTNSLFLHFICDKLDSFLFWAVFLAARSKYDLNVDHVNLAQALCWSERSHWTMLIFSGQSLMEVLRR